ncbi:MAG TPA: PKD domain-containing protein [Solirubrobacteraceae bacterium]|nr:PKD domain-containing protein [Solirubrobacteraceae bacterium]
MTNGEVKAIAHSGSITYIGGTFTEVGPATGPGVGINESTGADLGWARIWGSGGSISAVVSDGSGGYYIGGSFSEVAGHPAENLAHIRSNGEVDTGWLPKANGEVKALAVSGEIVYVGGSFTVIGTNSAARNRIAALKASGVAGEGEATTWNPNASTAASAVNALAVSGTSIVYVGGSFETIGSTPEARNRIAAINTNATATVAATDTTWNPNAASGEVKALAVSGTSIVYVGGSFETIGSTPEARHRIAAINTNATATVAATDTTWNPNASTAASAVNALAVSGEIVYVGGTFTTIGSTPETRNRIAAIKTNATATVAATDTTWNPNANAAVNALVLSGEIVYVGGTFTVIGTNNLTRNRIAAINTNATATVAAEATAWNPNANGAVLVVAIAGSGARLYIGGAFTSLATGDRSGYASFTFGGPTALFSVSAGPYTAGVTTVTFTNESTDAMGSITAYEWTFGDGGTAPTASSTHEYSAPCSPCTITLKVTDAEGLSAEVSHTITVAEGTLTFFTTSPTLPVLPSVVLNGEPRTTTTTMSNFTVDDARGGAGAGWNVTVASLATVGTTVSEKFKEYCNSASPCGPNAAERYVSGGRELPANSLTLKKIAASFTALPGATGSAPALECASECHIDHSTPEKVASAAAGGAGKGGWQTTGFTGASLSLATPMNLYVLPNANEVYRVDIVWTLNSGP